MSNILREVTICTRNNDERLRVGTFIHNQLSGNQDYVDCKIILNIDKDCTVRLTIFDDVKEIPEIKLF